MQSFTQKYAIVQLFEEVPVGTKFGSNSWPLHSTIVDTFAIDWDLSTMCAQLAELLMDHTPATSVVNRDEFFGAEKEIRVALLDRSASLIKLHYDLVKLLNRGGLVLNDPQYALDGFKPHSTIQTHARLNEDDKLTFTELSVIDFYPDKDPYMRKVLATIPIGKNHSSISCATDIINS